MKNQVDYIAEKGKNVRVLVNGTDISDCVESADFEGGHDEVPFIRLKCLAHKIVVDGDENADIRC